MIDKKLKEEIERVRDIVRTANGLMSSNTSDLSQFTFVALLKRELLSAETCLLSGNPLRMLGAYEALKKIKAEWKTDGTLIA